MAYKSSARGAQPVRLIVVHTAEGARDAESLGNYFYRNDVQASSHVGIDADSTNQYVPYDRAAWTVRSGNPISDNAELCAFARWTRAQWLSTTTVDGCANPRAILDRTAAWIRSRCLARNIPIRKLSPADVAAGRAGVIGHVDWTLGMHDGTHTDPGPNFPWDYVIERAAETDGFDMLSKEDVSDAVFDGNRRALASGELLFKEGNLADCIRQLRNSTVDLQTKGKATNEKLDALVTAVGDLTAAVKALAVKP